MKINAISDLFPLMNPAEFEALCTDIRSNGLCEAIWTYQDEIIDGRNRYNACLEVGVEPRFRVWDGTGSLISFVVSLNLTRRHLSESQRAMIAAKLAQLKQGERKPISTATTEENSNAGIPAFTTQREAAELLNISRDSVQTAKKVLDNGVLDLAEMVEAGEISLNAAVAIASQPKGKQKRLIKKKDRNKIVAFASNLRVEKNLKSAKSTADVCLLCNPKFADQEIGETEFVSFLHATIARLKTIKGGGALARYLAANIEEIEELGAADEIREDYDSILSAIDNGFRTEADIARFTRLDRHVLAHELKCLEGGGTIVQVPQGGKTAVARGRVKMLWQRTETGENSPASAAFMHLPTDSLESIQEYKLLM